MFVILANPPIPAMSAHLNVSHFFLTDLYLVLLNFQVSLHKNENFFGAYSIGLYNTKLNNVITTCTLVINRFGNKHS